MRPIILISSNKRSCVLFKCCWSSCSFSGSLSSSKKRRLNQRIRRCTVVALKRTLNAAEPVGAATRTKSRVRPVSANFSWSSCRAVCVAVVLPVPAVPSRRRRKGTGCFLSSQQRKISSVCSRINETKRSCKSSLRCSAFLSASVCMTSVASICS